MKKTFFLITLLWLSLVFVGCDKKPTQQNIVPDNQETYTEELNNVEVNEVNNEEINNEEINNEPEIYSPEYVTDTHEEMSFEEIEDTLMSCDDLGEELVCGADGGTYYNRCYLEFAWIPEDTAAKIVDWICVYE